MPGIDDLPPDRKAVLQLLLKQGKSYDDLAGLLRIAPETVRERAHDAVVRLGPADGAGLDRGGQEEVTDYLLGQQSASERAATRRFLEGSPEGRAWARVVSGEMRAGGVAAEALPDIPAERAEVDEAFDALDARKEARVRQARSSRLGGVLLLAAVGIAVAFVIVFLVSGSNDDNGTASNSSASTTSTTTSTASGQPQVLGQINLNAPKGSSSKALAAVTLLRQNDETDILFQGQNIPPNSGRDVYALWVVGSGGASRLGFTPHVKANGRLRFPGALPSTVDLSKYQILELTRETTANPSRPGPAIIVGKLP